MQAAQNLSPHLSQEFAVGLSLEHEKLKKILIRGRESREWGNNSYGKIRPAVLGRRQR